MSSPLIDKVTHHLATRARWGALEYVFWLAALASIFFLPSRHLILTEIAWLALFALSLDLILGYAGIISLGHAAFFGLGSYAAALLAKHAIINEPVLALVVSGVAAALLGFATSFLVLRGSDLTRLMVTLGVRFDHARNRQSDSRHHGRRRWSPRRHHRAHSRSLPVRYFRSGRLHLLSDCTVCSLSPRAAHRLFARSGCRCGR